MTARCSSPRELRSPHGHDDRRTVLRQLRGDGKFISFEGAKITDAWFYNADISGDLEGLRLNGVEVAPLVMAELERRSPERAKLRAADPAGLADASPLPHGTSVATTYQ